MQRRSRRGRTDVGSCECGCACLRWPYAERCADTLEHGIRLSHRRELRFGGEQWGHREKIAAAILEPRRFDHFEGAAIGQLAAVAGPQVERATRPEPLHPAL